MNADEILEDLKPDLEAIEFVEWDRFTVGDWDGQEYVTVYGWIDRPDDHEDFVVLLRWANGYTYFTTSSAEHTERIHEILWPDDPIEEHNECQRVEDYLDLSNSVRLMTDGGQVQCGYCGTTDLAYRLESDRGTVVRCIECLAIEQLQQPFKMPFDVWLDRERVEPPDQEEFPDAPDFEPFDPREHDYQTVRAWATVLARLKDDEPIVKRDPEAIGTIFEDTRQFLINVMGSDAHKSLSELTEGEAVATDGGFTVGRFPRGDSQP